MPDDKKPAAPAPNAQSTPSQALPQVRAPLQEYSGQITEPRGIGQLFLFKKGRRPNLIVRRNWEPPRTTIPSAQAGGKPQVVIDQQKLYEGAVRSGFIVPADIERFAQDNAFPINQFGTLQADVSYLLDAPLSVADESSFLRRFKEADQRALHFQNLYYFCHWVFAVGAFLTTLLSVFSVAAPDGAARTTLWLLTATAGLITTIFTYVNNQVRPQLKWYINRRRTEIMRRHYYLYMTHQGPYTGDTTQRRSKLAEIIEQIESIGTTAQTTMESRVEAEAPPIDTGYTPIFTPEELLFLVNLYRERRVQAQASFYRNRQQEFEENSFFVLLASTSLMAVATAFGGANALITDNNVLAILTTVLPSAAGVFLSVQQVYGWDRQATLYNDSVINLRAASRDLELGSDYATLARNFAKGVSACEAAIAAETDQWGQGVLDRAVAYTASTTVYDLEKLIESSPALNDAQKAQALKAFKQAVGADVAAGASAQNAVGEQPEDTTSGQGNSG